MKPNNTLSFTDETDLFTLVNTRDASISSRIHAAQKLFSDLADTIEKLDLNAAVLSSNLAVIKLLIDAGVDVNQVDWRGEAPIHLACGINTPVKIGIISELLQNGADINKLSDRGETPLGIAIQCWDARLIKFLITNKADVNKQCLQGTPLVLTLTKYFHPNDYRKLAERYEVIKFLVEHGADVNIPRPDGTTPLILSCINKFYKITKLLLEHGAEINATNKRGRTVWNFINNFSDEDYKKYLTLLKRYTK